MADEYTERINQRILENKRKQEEEDELKVPETTKYTGFTDAYNWAKDKYDRVKENLRQTGAAIGDATYDAVVGLEEQKKRVEHATGKRPKDELGTGTRR